jgi:two-component system, NarL family, sensor histidine kinase UhpB
VSLRLRLFISIALVLALTLILGGGLIYLHAVKKVDTEMQAAIDVGLRTVQNATDDAEEATDPRQRLELLVADFDGNRHVQAFLMNKAGVAVARSLVLASPDPAPEWFYNMIARQPEVLHIDLPPAFARYGSIILSTDSHNEIAETWSDFVVTLVILALFCTLVLALVYFTLGGPLRLLQNMSTAFKRIGRGDYSPRITETGARELMDLSRCFNDMVVRLSAMKEQNRRLQTQLTTVQEEERADLARDLHDEIGPLLFALNIDVSTLQQQDWRRSKEKVAMQLDAMSRAIGEMQLHVRSMLGKLRPAVLLDLGLDQAVDNLVSFWSKRHEHVRVAVELAGESFGEKLDATIYRIFQEGLNNALRHGNPSLVELKAEIGEDGFANIEVRDNGGGLSAADGSFGFGLIGMKERVELLGGVLTVANRADGCGVSVIARLPLETSDETMLKEPA